MSTQKAKFQKIPSPPTSDWKSCLRKLGRVSERSRNLGWKEARENYRKVLLELEESSPVSPRLYEELASANAFVGGDEHLNVQINSDPQRIYKLSAHDQFGVTYFFDPDDSSGDGRYFLAIGNEDPYLYLLRWKLLNEISSYQTNFEGIVAPEKGSFLPRICVSQPYVEGPNPSVTQITQVLQGHGYQEVSQRAYFSLATEVLLTDTFPRNVRIHGGLPALFDSVASRPTGEVEKWLYQKVKAS